MAVVEESYLLLFSHATGSQFWLLVVAVVEESYLLLFSHAAGSHFWLWVMAVVEESYGKHASEWASIVVRQKGDGNKEQWKAGKWRREWIGKKGAS